MRTKQIEISNTRWYKLEAGNIFFQVFTGEIYMVVADEEPNIEEVGLTIADSEYVKGTFNSPLWLKSNQGNPSTIVNLEGMV